MDDIYLLYPHLVYQEKAFGAVSSGLAAGTNASAKVLEFFSAAR